MGWLNYPTGRVDLIRAVRTVRWRGPGHKRTT